jgi:hypothetical protein
MKELVNDEYINNLFEILEDGSFKELFIEKLKKLEFSKWKEQLQIKRENNLKWIEDNKILEQIAEIEKELTSIFNESYEIITKLKEQDLKFRFLKNKKPLNELDKQQRHLITKSEQLKSEIVRIFLEVENRCGFTLAEITDKDYSFKFFRYISQGNLIETRSVYYNKQELDYDFTYETNFVAEWDRLKCQILKCSAISEIDGLISTYITDKYTLLNERI